MAEAAADTVEDSNMIAFEKFEKICDLADKNLEIGGDLVAQFLAELEKLKGEDVEDIEDLKETVKEQLEWLLEELTQQRANGTIPESSDSKLSSCVPVSRLIRSAFQLLMSAILRNSSHVEFKSTTTSPEGTNTFKMYAGITNTFEPKTPENHASNS